MALYITIVAKHIIRENITDGKEGVIKTELCPVFRKQINLIKNMYENSNTRRGLVYKEQTKYNVIITTKTTELHRQQNNF